MLDRQAAQLEKADDIRAHWYAHTANTRAAEQRARVELAARGIDPDTDERDTTAEQWLDAHRADQAVEDQHREITDEHDLTDLAEARDADQRASRTRTVAATPPRPTSADIRDQAAREPKREPRAEHDWTRVPTAGRNRRHHHPRPTRPRRTRSPPPPTNNAATPTTTTSRKLARWHADDRAAQRAAADEHDLGRAM